MMGFKWTARSFRISRSVSNSCRSMVALMKSAMGLQFLGKSGILGGEVEYEKHRKHGL